MTGPVLTDPAASTLPPATVVPATPAVPAGPAVPTPPAVVDIPAGPRGSLLARVLILPIRGYQLFISPALPPTCRYYPSCSAYAVEALRVHGAIKGSWLAIRRILRCHPWHWSGYDPVPPRGVRRSGAQRRALALMVAAGAESSEPASTEGGPSSPSVTTPVRTRRDVAQPPSRSASAAATTAGSSAA